MGFLFSGVEELLHIFAHRFSALFLLLRRGLIRPFGFLDFHHFSELVVDRQIFLVFLGFIGVVVGPRIPPHLLSTLRSSLVVLIRVVLILLVLLVLAAVLVIVVLAVVILAFVLAVAFALALVILPIILTIVILAFVLASVALAIVVVYLFFGRLAASCEILNVFVIELFAIVLAGPVLDGFFLPFGVDVGHRVFTEYLVDIHLGPLLVLVAQRLPCVFLEGFLFHGVTFECDA